MKLSKSLPIIFLAIITFSFSACTEYWWSRGKPPSTKALVDRSQGELKELIAAHQGTRVAVAKVSNEIESALSQALESANSGNIGQMKQHLEAARVSFQTLEGKISIGSRAPYGELAGQLRNFINNSGSTNPNSLALFVARTYFFLGNELTVPAPTFG